MNSKGYWRVAKFFKRHTKSILLFAYKRLKGIAIPPATMDGETNEGDS